MVRMCTILWDVHAKMSHLISPKKVNDTRGTENTRTVCAQAGVCSSGQLINIFRSIFEKHQSTEQQYYVGGWEEKKVEAGNNWSNYLSE